MSAEQTVDDIIIRGRLYDIINEFANEKRRDNNKKKNVLRVYIFIILFSHISRLLFECFNRAPKTTVSPQSPSKSLPSSLRTTHITRKAFSVRFGKKQINHPQYYENNNIKRKKKRQKKRKKTFFFFFIRYNM